MGGQESKALLSCQTATFLMPTGLPVTAIPYLSFLFFSMRPNFAQTIANVVRRAGAFALRLALQYACCDGVLVGSSTAADEVPRYYIYYRVLV